jgi:hypothetical protein
VAHDGAEGTIFYWFVGQYDHDMDAPLVLWSNGGPGSSAMIGFFAENGPYVIQEDLTLKKNPHSWARQANMLYIDHPVSNFVFIHTLYLLTTRWNRLELGLVIQRMKLLLHIIRIRSVNTCIKFWNISIVDIQNTRRMNYFYLERVMLVNICPV